MDILGPIEGWLEGAADTEGWAEGWLVGFFDSEGLVVGIDDGFFEIRDGIPLGIQGGSGSTLQDTGL